MHATDPDLEKRLASLEVDYDTAAIDRAIAAGERASGHHGRRRRGLLAGATLAGVIALIVSPAGGALAGAFSDLVGIGGQPSRSDQIDPQAAFPPARDQRVIATGLTPDGLDYEVIATASRYDIPLGVGQRFGMCVDVDVPAMAANSRRTYWPVSCVNDEVGRAMDIGKTVLEVRPALPELAPATALTASDWVPLDVESVEVTYEDGEGNAHQAPVALGRIDGELAEEIKAPVEIGFFTALIPAEVFGSTANADGLLDRCEVRAALSGITATLKYSSDQPARTVRPDKRYEVPILLTPPEPFNRPLGRDGTAREVMRPSDCAAQ